MAETSTPQGEQRRYLVVRSGGVRCAIPARSVRRVVRGLPITPVPGSARRLVGLTHHDGDPIVVLDLLELLDLGLGETSGPLEVTVVARVGPSGEELVGLGVDDAIEVASLDLSDLQAPAPGPVAGEVLVGGQLVRVLDLEALGGWG